MFMPLFHSDNRVERIFLEISNSIHEGSLAITLNLKKLQLVVSRFTALTGLLVRLLCRLNICEVIVFLLVKSLNKLDVLYQLC